MSRWIKQTSIGYLKESLSTDNQIADMVASNYGVYRNQGGRAKGALRLKLYHSQSIVYAESLFDAGITQLVTQKTIRITSSAVQSTTDSVQIVKSYRNSSDSSFYAVIPVVAYQYGKFQIPAGTVCTTRSVIQSLQEQSLQPITVISPISGGQNVQTDADMMRRCQTKCQNNIGTNKAILNKLQQSGISVISGNSVGTSQSGTIRGCYNNMLLPVIPTIDSYVKTRNQPVVQQLNIKLTDSNINLDDPNQVCIKFTGPIYDIIDVIVDGQSIYDYQVQYQSMSKQITADFVRFSCYQAVVLKIPNKNNLSKDQFIEKNSVVVNIKTMPDIQYLQTFIQQDQNSFIGQDIIIKAAIPIQLHIDCVLQCKRSLTDAQFRQIRQQIADVINSYPVGTSYLNMDDISSAIRAKYKDVSLKLPYTILYNAYGINNQGTYTFHTNSGYIDLVQILRNHNKSYKGYYMYTTSQFINLRLAYV